MNRGNRVGAVCDELTVTNDGGGSRRSSRSSSGVVEVLGAVLTLLSAVFILLSFPLTGWMCAKVIHEYERAVIFRLGRVVKGRAKGPGLFWFIPWLDVIQTVDLRTVSFNIQPQEVLTADGVSLKVDAVVFYRVVDPSSWVTRVEDGYRAIHTLTQTTLRAALGAHTLTDVLTQRTGIARRIEDHYLDVGIKQRAREMIQAAMYADNPLRDGEQSAEKRTRLSAPDVEHAPSLSDMFNEILRDLLHERTCLILESFSRPVSSRSRNILFWILIYIVHRCNVSAK
ncbi:erythrocyte band 7 integral membrane protein isoform X4 [Larimichthys crocea]|uniref:erythrocyte band 7 integral membrane protein isoform X4 n=1 Tax=Larimichthys crocea TaxID=215358 RepID=UPI000F603745|nr:erythrocyte band 7 integral membrane protein isoform X4 [Larimichthys crocea]